MTVTHTGPAWATGHPACPEPALLTAWITSLAHAAASMAWFTRGSLFAERFSHTNCDSILLLSSNDCHKQTSGCVWMWLAWNYHWLVGAASGLHPGKVRSSVCSCHSCMSFILHVALYEPDSTEMISVTSTLVHFPAELTPEYFPINVFKLQTSLH